MRVDLFDFELPDELIARHPLAQLVVSSPDGLLATPVPLVRRGDTMLLRLVNKIGPADVEIVDYH